MGSRPGTRGFRVKARYYGVQGLGQLLWGLGQVLGGSGFRSGTMGFRV
jgi:hypothetical protein